MESNNIEVIDLLENTSPHWKTLFSQMIENLQKTSNQDRLLKNYVNLAQSYRNYESFTVLTQKEEIIGFSGMHGDIYPTGTSRVLSRLYYAPNTRVKNLAGRSLPSLASKYMLPVQLKKARGLKKSHVFLSFEGLNRRPFCYKLAATLRDYYKEEWYVYEDMCCTARKLPDGETNMSKDVWQNIVLLHLNQDHKFSLPSVTVEEWTERFC